MLTLFKVDTFHLQNPWFQVLKPRLSDCNLMGFRNRSHVPQKMNIYAVLGGRWRS